jgi:hypothetical protein
MHGHLAPALGGVRRSGRAWLLGTWTARDMKQREQVCFSRRRPNRGRGRSFRLRIRSAMPRQRTEWISSRAFGDWWRRKQAGHSTTKASLKRWLRHGNRRGGNSRRLQTPPSLLLTTPAEPPGPPLAKPGFAPGGVAGQQFVGAGWAPGAGLVRLDRRWRVQ